MASLARFLEAGAFGVLNDILSTFHSDEGYAIPNRFEVLPQYFYRFLCDKSTTEKSLDILKKMDYHPNIKNETSFDHRLERNEELKDLFIFFEYCLNEIKDDLYMECDKLKITQAWANKSTENQNHHWHNHPNSFLSASP